MSRVLYIDARSAGAAGDMLLGAAIDLGVSPAQVRKALEGLPLSGYRLSSRRITRASLRVRRVHVRLDGDHHAHRGWREIRRILSKSGLAPAVRRRAEAVFRRLLEAEAEVHGKTFDSVHLHEAGGIDAIVDVVGTCFALDRLAPDRIVVSPMRTGFGQVRCAHGVYPIPAPATALLCRGVPVFAGDIPGEHLTPTGAALLTTLADEWGEMPAMTPETIGYGAGSREREDDPNALRMVLGHSGDVVEEGAGDEVVVLEWAMDDIDPQRLAHACERLLEAGALDVTTAAVTMKKGRSGHALTALCAPGDFMSLSDLVFRETGTLGLRYRRERRRVLPRETARVKTPYGAVTLKVGILDGEIVRAWPEHDECATLARKKKVSLEAVREAALRAYRELPAKKRLARKR
ncbi:hypothetical protein ABI59_05770 [Acidobacteria bacterium Mor1]|nr:hypothetical protein ABI59_05770 [Acidobacteria bacterium Mor1]